MNNTSMRSVLDKPLTSAWARPVAMTRAAQEYDALAKTLEELDAGAWSAPTACSGWDVRAMAGHCLGMAMMMTSFRETVRQQLIATKQAKREAVPLIDALTALQVREHADLSTGELLARFAEVGPRAVQGRRRVRWPMRLATVADGGAGATPEKWRMGYLVDTILTRDPWMHRADIAAATGLPMHLTADHDGAIVDNVVREWAARHAQPYRLTLTGPAGGHWSRGEDGEQIEMDAVEFCRVLSGRGAAAGLAGTRVPF